MDDYIDDDGTIWIWKLLGGCSSPALPADPATRALRWRLAEHRIAEIEREAEANVEALRTARKRK